MSGYISPHSGQELDKTIENHAEIIKGYYDSTADKFYEESTHETEITGNVKFTYIDLTNLTALKAYIFDGTGYLSYGGGNSGDALWEEGTGAEAIATKANASQGGQAIGDYSVAEGFGSDAKGKYSHVEGQLTTANGDCAHSEGQGTTAQGNCSHAEGMDTITQNQSEHAEGQYNKSTKTSTTFGNAGNTIHSIGIGTGAGSLEDQDRRNAIEVMQNGDIYAIGVGSYTGDNFSSAQTLQSVINGKVNSEEGKGLSTNDFTNALKTKLDNITEGATKVQGNYTVANGTILINGTQTIVYDDTAIRQALAGINRNYAIDDETSITGTKDPDTNIWTNVTVITGVDLSKVNIGDNVFVRDPDVPDYWISGKTDANVITLDPLDTKVDLDNYYNKTQVDNLLAIKAPLFETITLSGSSGTLTEEQKAKILANPFTTILDIDSYKYRYVYHSSTIIYYQRLATTSNYYIMLYVASGSWVRYNETFQTTSNIEQTISTNTSKYPSSNAVTKALAEKQNTITGGATSITASNLTASRALVSDSSGKVAVSPVTSTELGYLDGVTSAIQTQLNGKQNTLTAGTNITISGTTISAKDTTYSVATTSANGLMSSTDKSKLDGIAAGAQVNTVTGVKGNSETSYRTGNINITAANIGLGSVVNTGDSATPVSGGTTKFTTGGAYTELAKKFNISNFGGVTNVLFVTQLPTSPVANTLYFIEEAL